MLEKSFPILPIVPAGQKGNLKFGILQILKAQQLQL